MMPEPSVLHPGWLWLAAVALLGLVISASGESAEAPRRLDPAAWGSDHVDKPVPSYATGDECLFCHREKIGPTWSSNRHNLTIRHVDDQSPAIAALRQSSLKELAGEVQYLMGNSRHQRFLKPAKDYGKLEVLSAEWTPARADQPAKLTSASRGHWDANLFGDSCAGCHTTAVDPRSRAFSAISLDCFVCHGNVPPEHSKKPELAHLSRARKEHPREITSICAQCHVRTGKSRSTGRPYSTNFVAGDNLFRDFEVDFSDENLRSLSVADRHVLENVRSVVLFGRNEVTCLSCHNVHGQSSKKHHRLAKTDYCLNCHHAEGPMSHHKPLTAHSKTCGY